MKFNFRKITSVLACTAMLGSTIGFATAAAYPTPFVSGGSANVAIVVGSTAANSDLLAATDIGTNLGAALASQSASTGGTVTLSGETYPLFTSSSKLFLNSSLNANRETVTASNLPTVLKEGTFEGDVSTTYEQRITVGSNPVVAYAKQPTNDDDAVAGLKIGTSANTQYLYNASVIFGQTVNFTHADSKGQPLDIFGGKFTVGSATTNSKLILFKSSKTLFLDSGTSPSETVEIDGKTYTVELVSATDTSANIKITDSTGKSESKEVNEAASKKINGLEVAINNADESTALNKISAEVIVGASRITLQNGNAVKVGSDDTIIDGTNVQFFNAANTAETNTWNISKIVIQASADSSDEDAVTPGHEFIDPVFGSFKLTFPGLNIADNSATDREVFEVKNSGGDKMVVKFQSHEASEAKSVEWAYNKTTSQAGIIDLADSDGDQFIMQENALVNKSGYVILPNTDEGGLYEVTDISNSSSATASDDQLTVKNVMTGESITAKATSEGSGTFTAQGKLVSYTYTGASTLSNEARRVRFNFQESSGNDVILYPTIKTKKGAKVTFYEPLSVNLSSFDGTTNNITNFRLENGNGYTAVAITNPGQGNDEPGNFTIGGTVIYTNNSAGVESMTVAVGKLTYNFSSSGTNEILRVRLMNPQGTSAIIATPAIVIFDEKDNSNNYEANIVTLDAGYDGSSAGIGVQDVVRTWELDASANLGNEIQLESNSDLYRDIDWFGVITTLDKSDSDQTTAMISYPDDQVYAQVYVGETAAIASTGGSSSTIVPIRDTEIDSVKTKNLIVVGGSCINSIAAKLLGSETALCGAGFTSSTQVGTGQYLIKTFQSPYSTSAIATLVAGYEAADTKNAVTALTTKKPDTSVGKKYIGTTADTFTESA